MTIHTFAIPTLLASHLQSGGYKFSESEEQCLMAMLTRIDSPRPKLWGQDEIVSEHKLWNSTAVTYYLGNESAQVLPGRIDPTLALIIGEADEDSPIALDYRTNEPRVVYLGGSGPQSVWIELAPSYKQFLDRIKPPS